jgi:hypothetical protein
LIPGLVEGTTASNLAVLNKPYNQAKELCMNHIENDPVVQVDLIQNLPSAQRRQISYQPSISPPTHIYCANPTCQHGGFEIGSIIREMLAKHETIQQVKLSCQGLEGKLPPRWQDLTYGELRQRGVRRCLWELYGTISIQYPEMNSGE